MNRSVAMPSASIARPRSIGIQGFHFISIALTKAPMNCVVIAAAMTWKNMATLKLEVRI
jgi:hypothetical protein